MSQSKNSAIQLLFSLLNVSNFADLSQYVKIRYDNEIKPLLKSSLMSDDDPCIYETVMDIAMGEYFLINFNKLSKLNLEIHSNAMNVNNISKKLFSIINNIESTYSKCIDYIKDANIAAKDIYNTGQDMLDEHTALKSTLSKIEIRLMELRERDRVQDARQAHLDLERQELDRRQKEMDRRQAELDRRQAELDNRALKHSWLRWFTGA